MEGRQKSMPTVPELEQQEYDACTSTVDNREQIEQALIYLAFLQLSMISQMTKNVQGLLVYYSGYSQEVGRQNAIRAILANSWEV